MDLTTGQKIAKELERNLDGRPWFGGSIGQILKGVTAGQAAAHPVEGAHSIWEILLHMIAWRVWVRRAVGGKGMKMLEGEADWPPVKSSTPVAWRRTLATIKRENAALAKAIAAFPEEKLGARAPGKPYPNWFMIEGIVRHDIYHAGQIGILRKASGGRRTGEN